MGGGAGVEGCVLKAHHSLFDWLRNCVILIHCILSKIKNFRRHIKAGLSTFNSHLR